MFWAEVVEADETHISCPMHSVRFAGYEVSDGIAKHFQTLNK
jgi:hypothetical protein